MSTESQPRESFTALFEALADVARAVTEAVQAFMDTLRAALRRSADRRRSTVRRRDAVVPVDPVWPARSTTYRRPAYRREPHIRIRPGDIPDRYGNYPY